MKVKSKLHILSVMNEKGHKVSERRIKQSHVTDRVSGIENAKLELVKSNLPAVPKPK